jgi:hypothetical protein
MESLPASALAPGADLWIVPERKQSSLTQKIDWYLNFQIAKSVQHQSQDLSPIVGEILRSCALKNYDFLHEDSDALLILSTRTLPNRWVMVLKGSSDLNDWLQIALQKWKKMNSPSLRIFLPEGARTSEVSRIWKKLGGSDNVTFIEETDTGK